MRNYSVGTQAEPGFQSELRVETVDARNWRLLQDFSWVGSKDTPDVFTIQRGEITDFASVPWFMQSLLPRTGTWTKAAVLHDKMCVDLYEFHRRRKAYYQWAKDFKAVGGDVTGFFADEPKPPIPLRFSSNDADAIFRKNCRDGGTGRIRSELLWFGVRCGALRRPRRDKWLRTFPRFLMDLVAIVIVLVGTVAFLSWIWPW